MSGRGPDQTTAKSKYVKPLREQYDQIEAEHRNSDHGFKKSYQEVGKPKTLDHNVMDDYVKQPPHNNPDLPPRDYLTQDNEREPLPPNTVEAKSVEEIQARLDKIEKGQK
ncbi:hypothetical protein P389DRAFT_74389 [Cystobasidium minutum MCA 4210]|uniref:uncharacterized protein n=1 Tax=Cystobasidium minutum MCA 4210 TaxID=1397322 RepID=UPI0034CEE78F|eukprot:jgi/Rhomi1/74389/CE74388_25902